MSEILFSPGIEHGAFSYRRAALILGVSSSRVGRWADGYTYARKHDFAVSGPVLQTTRDLKVLNFYELVELLFVKEYIKLGVKLPVIRKTAEKISTQIGVQYPFANSEVFASGPDLLVPGDETYMKRADIGQMVYDFAALTKPHLKFDSAERAYRFTLPNHEHVILDATIRAGEPSVSEFMVPTRHIYRLWLAETSNLGEVCDYFDIEPEYAKAAIEFESNSELTA